MKTADGRWKLYRPTPHHKRPRQHPLILGLTSSFRAFTRDTVIQFYLFTAKSLKHKRYSTTRFLLSNAASRYNYPTSKRAKIKIFDREQSYKLEKNSLYTYLSATRPILS